MEKTNETYVSTITWLKNQYLEMLEISDMDAMKNARYIFKNLSIKNEFDEEFSSDKMKPVVKIIETIYDKEKAEKVMKHMEEFGEAPDWVTDGDYGFSGKILPYLAECEITPNDNVYYATLESGGFKNQEGENIFARTNIIQLFDKKKQIYP